MIVRGFLLRKLACWTAASVLVHVVHGDARRYTKRFRNRRKEAVYQKNGLPTARIAWGGTREGADTAEVAEVTVAVNDSWDKGVPWETFAALEYVAPWEGRAGTVPAASGASTLDFGLGLSSEMDLISVATSTSLRSRGISKVFRKSSE